jgi:L-asparaginase/Glu-tRNA(Gln) amidotransferase subunit D
VKALRHVHVLFTGGTISMRIDPGTGAAVPALSG